MLLIESLGTAEKGPVVDVSTTLQGILSAFLGGGVVCVCVCCKFYLWFQAICSKILRDSED